jgi:hypothetical protein
MERYASLLPPGSLTQEDVEYAQEFLKGVNFASMEEWADSHTQTFELGNGQAYRMVVDRPSDGDPSKAVIVGGEFGNGIAAPALARARIIREMVDPEATLVYQPNTTFGQSNANFSREEREKLRHGDITPMIGRIGLALAEFGDPDDLVFSGPSQGGTIALGYASHPDTPAAAVAVIEAPNVSDRSIFGIARDFVGSGGELKDIVRENYDIPEGAELEAQFARETLDALGVAGMLRFVAGFPRRDNMAMLGAMRIATAESQILDTLRKGGSVVHAYGTVNRVSPAEANAAIKSTVHEANYIGVELRESDHSVTNNYALSGALARLALRIRPAA